MAVNGIEMITDRSPSDVEIAKSLIKKSFQNMTDAEKEAFLLGLKGAYNYTDFNRVETAVLYLAQRLVDVPEEIRNLAQELGVYWEDVFDVKYNPEDYKSVEGKNDWSINDILTEEQRNGYLSRIVYVLQALTVPDDFPRTLNGLTYAGANAIERAIVNFNASLIELQENKNTLLQGTAKTWFYSGDLYGGEII